MTRANVLGAALLVAGTIATATPAAAQVTVGADLGLFSDYVWRGITYTNKFVLQPDVYLTIPTGPASFTAGGWFNIEPGKYDGATDISESGGESSFDVAEFDWWGEFNYPYQKANFTLGALAGLNAGQGIPDDPNSDQSFNFVDNGFTHLDLSAAVPFTAGPLSISPVVHVVVTGDDATKFTKFDPNTGTLNSKDVKVWFGGTISWSKALGEAPAEETTE